MSARPSRAGVLALLSAGLLAAAPAGVAAWEMQGLKTIAAHTRDGERIVLGSVRFAPRADGSVAFALTMDHARFTDYFLSMKEFKCLAGRGEIVCHVPYPHAQPGVVGATDLAWLEHNLLFLYQLPTEFGAKLWNGLYFRLERTASGLIGRPQAIDLNHIGAPPDDPGVPPYAPALRDDIAPGARWIESLSIE